MSITCPILASWLNPTKMLRLFLSCMNLEARAVVQMVREISSQHEQHRENKHLHFSAVEQKEFRLSGPLTVTAADTKSAIIKTEASRFTSSHC